MTKLTPHYTNEETGISYTLSPEGYYLPEKPAYSIGRFGQMRRHYLQNHCPGLFIDLLTSSKLNEHLYEIDKTAHLLTTQIAASEGVTEALKSQSQMLWVGRMNNIRARAEEIIREELIYS